MIMVGYALVVTLSERVLRFQPASSHFLQISLHNKMFHIRPPHHKPLSPLEVNRPYFRLDDSAVPDYANVDMQILRRSQYRGEEIDFLGGKYAAAEGQHRIIIRPQKVDFVRR